MTRLAVHRKPGESVVIYAEGVEIEVFVSESRSRGARIVFDAPHFVKILRKELTGDHNQGNQGNGGRRSSGPEA